MELKKIKGAIFDMDGTILDSMPYWDRVDERFLTRRGFEYTEEVSCRLRTCSLEEAAVYFSENYGIRGTIEEIVDMIIDEMRPAYENEVTAKKGAEVFLKKLKEKGVLMCVATSTDRALTELVLGRLDLLKYFDGIFTCGEVGKNKIHPDIFEQALAFLGTEKEYTPVFEDSLHAVKTAKSAGFPVVAINDKTSYRDMEDIKKLSDIYVEMPEDLINML